MFRERNIGIEKHEGDEEWGSCLRSRRYNNVSRPKMKVLVYLILTCLLLLLHAPLFEWWCRTGIGQVLRGMEPSAFADAVAMVLLMISCGVISELPERLSDTGNKWGIRIAEVLILVIAIFSVYHNAEFVHFKTLSWLRYTDILFPILLVFWVTAYFERNKKNRMCDVERVEEGLQVLYDDTHGTDFLQRDERAEKICDFLSRNRGNTEGATGVAITGGWGTGKSWMLEQVKIKLISRGELCIDFKPWVYGDGNIIRHFYLTLERELKLHTMAVKELKDAVLEIDNDEIVGLGRAMLSLAGIISKTRGRDQILNNIKERLRTYGRQIYVFIDDCDRLAHDELLQLLSLIRNTGDFPLITYLMAFDENMVGRTLKDEDGINYVSKMFNMTEVLPPVTDETLAGYLKQVAQSIMGVENEQVNPYQRLKITKYLPTVREAKKYLNLLTADYHHLKERFDKYIVSSGDFCLLELLKYKYPEVYYGLEVAPNKYLHSLSKGWNSPVMQRKEDMFKGIEDENLRILLDKLFDSIDDARDQYGMIGVANKEYMPLYFVNGDDSGYVEWIEFTNAVKEGTLPDKVGEWIDDGHKGVLGLLCSVYFVIPRRDVFLSMAAYIWHKCEGINTINSLSELSYGYDKTQKHSYKNIRELIRKTPQVHLMTFQRLSSYDDPSEEENSDSMEGLIKDSALSLELMGIWMEEMRHTTNTDYPYGEVKYYIEKLWDKLMAEFGDKDIDTLNMIEIWADSTMENTFEEMVLPTVNDNPQRWLGATIVKLKDGEKDYYLLKSKAVHAIFGSKEKMIDEMKRLVADAKAENKEYVEAYSHLIFRLNNIINPQSDPMIPEMYEETRGVEVTELPALEDSKLIGIGPVMPVSAAVVKLRQTAFWEGDDLRMRRSDPGYYLGSEI